MFMFARLILMVPDKGNRREVPTLETRAVNIGRRGQGCFLAGRTFTQASLRVLWRHKGGNSGPTLGARSPKGEGCHKNSPDLAKSLRAADVDSNNALCRFSINLATTFDQR